MPSLASSKILTVKGLGYGESGMGKTGALASLANAGYKLRIADFDQGIDPLFRYVKPEFHPNVHFMSFTDKMKPVGKGLFPEPKGVPTAWVNFTKALDSWDDGLGGILSWGADTIFVGDSLTFMGRAAMRLILNTNKREGQAPWPQDYGQAQDMLMRAFDLLYSPQVRCHVWINAHFRYLEDRTVEQSLDDKGNPLPRKEIVYPSAIGKMLPPIMGRFFNTMVIFKMQGNRRVIKTTPEENMMAKVPVAMAEILPIETGLSTIFEAILGHASPA